MSTGSGTTAEAVAVDFLMDSTGVNAGTFIAGDRAAADGHGDARVDADRPRRAGGEVVREGAGDDRDGAASDSREATAAPGAPVAVHHHLVKRQLARGTARPRRGRCRCRRRCSRCAR